jgi:hypothetical protein
MSALYIPRFSAKFASPRKAKANPSSPIWLPTQCCPTKHLPASHDDKDVQFYKDILKETKSVEFSYTKRSEEGDTEIAFSKMVIFEALALAKWGGDSHSVRVLKSGLVYSYIDYIDARELALLFGNSLSKQSRFLLVRLSDTTNNPNWYLDWGFSLAAAPIFVKEVFRSIKQPFYNRTIGILVS